MLGVLGGSEGDFRRVDASLMEEIEQMEQMDMSEDMFCVVRDRSDVVLIICLLLIPPLRRVSSRSDTVNFGRARNRRTRVRSPSWAYMKGAIPCPCTGTATLCFHMAAC